MNYSQAMEAKLDEVIRRVEELRRERDELLAALEAIVCTPSDPRAVCMTPSVYSLMDGHALVLKMRRGRL